MAIKVLQNGKDYNHASLFKFDFDESVAQLWNYSYDQAHQLSAENLFAIDSRNNLVYLAALDQFIALDLYTGQVKHKIPLKPLNLQYFGIMITMLLVNKIYVYSVCYSH